jgi:nucleoside-diphosphate-sugar epimerase
MRCNPIYVDDAVTAVEQAMRAETHAIVNVAGSEIVSLREIGAKLARLQGREAHYLQRPGMSDLVADTTRMRHLLSAPRVSLSSGLQRLMESLPGERV